MSERSYAPRSGGRTTGTRRDADMRGSDARGARQFSGGTEGEPAGRADTRRSGMRRDEREGAGTPATRVKDRNSADTTRAKARETGSTRAKTRDTDPVRAKSRTTDPVRATSRTTDPARAKSRTTDPVRATSRTTGATGGRGRRPAMDAPVAGTAALQVEVTAEPLRITEPQLAPRLQVAPPAPISVPRAPFVAGIIGVVIAGVLGILLINTKTNENSFRIADLQNQESKLDNQQQDLDNQLVEISSIGNLDAAARRLGLVKADNPAMIRLPDGKVIGVLKPATGKQAVTAQGAKTDGDKGAANIVPQSGSPAEGLTPNGTTTAGPTPDGTTPNGSTTAGTTTNGTTPDGATTNGTTPNGATTNGTTTDGAGTGVPAAGQ